MGQHVWLLLATIGTELLVIVKWSEGQFPEPLPKPVKWAWGIGGTSLVLYPTVRVRALCFYIFTGARH
jgi:phosphatidylserine synthase 2